MEPRLYWYVPSLYSEAATHVKAACISSTWHYCFTKLHTSSSIVPQMPLQSVTGEPIKIRPEIAAALEMCRDIASATQNISVMKTVLGTAYQGVEVLGRVGKHVPLLVSYNSFQRRRVLYTAPNVKYEQCNPVIPFLKV